MRLASKEELLKRFTELENELADANVAYKAGPNKCKKCGKPKYYVGDPYDGMEDHLCSCDLKLCHGCKRRDVHIEHLIREIEKFLTGASFTPPWESAGAQWSNMLVRLNEAVVVTKETR